MSESPDEKYRKLPDQVRLEDTIASHPASPPVDPEEGLFPDQEQLKGTAI